MKCAIALVVGVNVYKIDMLAVAHPLVPVGFVKGAGTTQQGGNHGRLVLGVMTNTACDAIKFLAGLAN